ncbi:MAG TPA: LamG domain-containing protein, partial [Bacillota bacterium]|nr:LamG domain-containing protein [Bacillota bacterium]
MYLRADKITVGGGAPGLVTAKPQNAHLWHFDNSLQSTQGLAPVSGSATLVPDGGKFGGAVAVEEGTTNILWVEWEQGSLNPSNGSPHATSSSIRTPLIAVSPSTTYTFSVQDNAYVIRAVYEYQTDGTYIQRTIQSDQVFSLTTTANTGQIRATASRRDNKDLTPDAIEVFKPQAERKPFATSFVDGTRAAGKLEYPQIIWNHATGTFAAWVKTPTDVTTDRVLTLQWASDETGADTRFGIRMNTTGRFVVSYGSANTLTTAGAYNDGQWHHVALTWVDGTADIHFYVDGERVASASGPISVRNPGGRYRGVIPIGHRGYTYNDQWWNGLIDELLTLPYAATDA